MNEVKLRTTARLKSFLAGTELLELHISTVQQRYDFIDRTLKRFSYWALSKTGKGTVRKLLARASGVSLFLYVRRLNGSSD